MHRKGIASPIVGRAAYVPPKQDFTETLFNQFVKAQSFKGTLSSFFALCEQVKLEQFENHSTFFTSLKEGVKCWRANSLWSSLTPLAQREVYGGGSICARQRILIIGAGPCGLRTAIECALLGAKVVVVEKRDDFYRNNVLHLWPFVIKDLRKLGAKILYPKFCPGNINHISIRKLQVLLLKICLCLGVEVHQAGFVDLIEPQEDQSAGIGWRAKLYPEDHQLSTFEFDVVIGADGRRNSLKGFERKKAGRALAIAITFNFVNYNSSEEAKVGEIGGISFQFRQDFFQELKAKHGIELENLVYYKDETHYFVVTAKKASLLGKGVLKEDKPTVEELLSQPNVDQDQLKTYALELAKFSTTLPKNDFELNHHGGPDVAMFDFTSVFQACHPAIIRDKNGHKLLVALVGDGLYQPFWPQGTGCGRGFLSAFNAAWMIRDWALGEKEPLSILAERESLYLLLPVTPRGLSPAIDRYSIDPESRYLGLKTRMRVKADELDHLINPEENETVKRERREFADPWASVSNSSSTQRNHFTKNLAPRGSTGNGNGTEVEAEAAQSHVSENNNISNDGDQVPVLMQYGLRKVRNSLVAADAEEEMRRNQELNVERERGRTQKTQELIDPGEQIERNDKLNDDKQAVSSQTGVQPDSGEIRPNEGLDDGRDSEKNGAVPELEGEMTQDESLNGGEQSAKSQTEVLPVRGETSCNKDVNEGGGRGSQPSQEPSDSEEKMGQSDDFNDEGQVSRSEIEVMLDSEEMRRNNGLTDEREREGRQITQELSDEDEEIECNGGGFNIKEQTTGSRMQEPSESGEEMEPTEDLSRWESNNSSISPLESASSVKSEESNVEGQIARRRTQDLPDSAGEGAECNGGLDDAEQMVRSYDDEITCSGGLGDGRKLEGRYIQELPESAERVECNRVER